MGPSRRAFIKLLAGMPILANAAVDADPLLAARARLLPLFARKLAVRPGDWLEGHAEAGQTYAEFRRAITVPAVARFRTLRIVPIGPLSKSQDAVLGIVKDFLGPFFGLRLTVESPVALSTLPESAQRTPYYQAPKQLLTTHLLNRTLLQLRQDEDGAVLGITAMDLWPGPGWNFVFGQASLEERVGVWSMARNGDPDEGPEMRSLCASRTVKTATHETGHMFGIRHCTAYECGMNGSNHGEERDRQPLEFCPECQPKLWWTLGLDPYARSRALEAAALKHQIYAGGFVQQTRVLAPR